MPRLEAADFRSVENHHGFTISGRRFALLAFPAPATSDALEKLNRALRSFRVQPGDFYGDKVLPAARFPARPGWFAGARSGKLFAEGGQTETWASTTRYRDVPNQIPPHRTLSHLGRDGVILWVSLSRDSAIRARAYPDNSLHIDPQLIAANFEGLEPRFGLYRASVRRSQYEVGLWVFFGTLHPTTATVLRAQTQLDRLQLPRWPEG